MLEEGRCYKFLLALHAKRWKCQIQNRTYKSVVIIIIILNIFKSIISTKMISSFVLQENISELSEINTSTISAILLSFLPGGSHETIITVYLIKNIISLTCHET